MLDDNFVAMAQEGFDTTYAAWIVALLISDAVAEVIALRLIDGRMQSHHDTNALATRANDIGTWDLVLEEKSPKNTISLCEQSVFYHSASNHSFFRRFGARW